MQTLSLIKYNNHEPTIMREGQYDMIHKIHLQNFIHRGILLDNMPNNAIDQQPMINVKSIPETNVYNLI
jgi:hypothetical protein